MGLGIPPLKVKIMLESNPLQSRILVQYGDWPCPARESEGGRDDGGRGQSP